MIICPYSIKYNELSNQYSTDYTVENYIIISVNQDNQVAINEALMADIKYVQISMAVLFLELAITHISQVCIQYTDISLPKM